MTTSAWWRREAHADRRPFLLARNRLTTALRGWFAAHDFVEVDPGVVQRSPGNEAHLHAFETAFRDPAGARHPLYLHTSPEFAAKKLVAAGEERIFMFSHCFRNREAGRLHAPEFTMLEWYRAGESYDALMEDCAALLRLAAETAGGRRFRFEGRECDPFAEPERLSVADALRDHAGIDLLATISADGEATDRDGLAGQATAAGLRITADDSWSDIFSKLVNEQLEPHLGLGRPAILLDYPAAEAALARRKPGEPRLAERFELYVCGVELANAFGELTDAAEQRRRFELEMEEKQRIYGERYPLDEDLLAALPSMPPTAGIALGFDRLVMLSAGARSVSEVMWTRSEERRVGKECRRLCRSRWSPYH
jgi:lysyl-tRNA synthetase class 2